MNRLRSFLTLPLVGGLMLAAAAIVQAVPPPPASPPPSPIPLFSQAPGQWPSGAGAGFASAGSPTWFQFSAQAGKTYALEAFPTVVTAYPTLRLWLHASTSQSAPLRESDFPGDPVIRWTCPASGAFYVKVGGPALLTPFLLRIWEYYPVVFVHGINSDASVWNATMLELDRCGWRRWPTTGLLPNPGTANSPWKKRPAFAAISFAGRGRGGNFFGGVPSESLISQSRQLRTFIENFRIAARGSDPADPLPPVLIVAHSNGGLVARRYLQNPQLFVPGSVKTLLTYGTPHLGRPMLGLAELNTYYYGGLYTYGFAAAGLALDLGLRDNNTQSLFLRGGWEPQGDLRPVTGTFAPWNKWNLDVDGDGSRDDYLSGLNLLNTRPVNPPAPSTGGLTALPTAIAYLWVRSPIDGSVPYESQRPATGSPAYPATSTYISLDDNNSFLLHLYEPSDYVRILGDLGIPR